MAVSPKTITVQHADLARDIADVGKKLIDISMGLRRGVEVQVDYVRPVEIPTEPGLYRLSNNMVVELTKRRGWLSPNGLDYVARHVRESNSFVRLLPAKVAQVDFAKPIAAYWETMTYSDKGSEFARALRGFADGSIPIPRDYT